MKRYLLVSISASVIALVGVGQQAALAQGGPPAPPTNLTATDHPWDNGEVLDLTWDAPPGGLADGEYFILQTIAQVGDLSVTHEFQIIDSAAGPITIDRLIFGVKGFEHITLENQKQLYKIAADEISISMEWGTAPVRLEGYVDQLFKMGGAARAAGQRL